MAEEIRNYNYKLITSSREIRKTFNEEKFSKKSPHNLATSLRNFGNRFCIDELKIMKRTLTFSNTSATTRQTTLFTFISIIIALIAILVSADLFDNISGTHALSILGLSYVIVLAIYYWLSVSQQERNETYINYLELLIVLKGNTPS